MILKHGIKMTGMPAWSDHSDVKLWATAAFFLVLRPVFARLSDSRLALWVEDRAPQLEHRQLND